MVPPAFFPYGSGSESGLIQCTYLVISSTSSNYLLFGSDEKVSVR